MTRSDLPTEATFSLHSDQARAHRDAERLFARVKAELGSLLPACAEIHHVGATAVPGCLTKGDLDIAVRVGAEAFAEADAALAAMFMRNAGSKRTDAFSAFEDVTARPHLGVQLTAKGGADDYFHLFADALRRSAELVAAYNALKQQFDGKPMDAYRSAKSAFVEDVLRRQAG